MAATSHSLLSPAPTSLPRARLAFPAVRAVAPRRRPSFPAVAAAASSMASSEAEEKKETKLWGGRFEEGVTDAVERFTESISYDWQLYKYDIMGSKAHASMLAAQGLITTGDRDIILEGLDQIEKQIQDGKFEWRKDREDVHMNIEAALIEKVGEPAKKLHTARSRNDQIVTDLRLWCRDAIDKILIRIKQFQVSLVLLASKYVDLIVPGYTHLQRAQPVLLPHLLLSYVEQKNENTLQKGCFFVVAVVNIELSPFGCYIDISQYPMEVDGLSDEGQRVNFCPLGACALAGTGLPIDRFKTAKDLKFTAPMKNSIDAVSDRDFVLEFLAANSIAAIHLSRIGEEWVLWASEEFGFLTPSDSVSTGSSIMPQKKNPDPMELVRGKSARVVGDLMTVLVLCKGLPQAYNRDLQFLFEQEDKEPLFDSVKAILGMLEVCSEFSQNISFNSKRIQSSLPAGYLDATTLADYLVKKGVPFRTSHEIVGRCVALCVSKNCQLTELEMDDLKAVHPVFEADVYAYLGVENAVNKFISYGSTGSEQVKKQLEDWRVQLGINP
uniref:argininosuccinate lyase n=1 Tax=Aegilops tauschii TaxID=37682 RepID=M8CD44_AEGTA